MNDAVAQFLRNHAAAAVGPTPVQPTLLGGELEGEGQDTVDRDIENLEKDWDAIPVPEHPPARKGEYPERFIDGSHAGQPVLCIRSPQGWPIPMILAEVGAVMLCSEGRGFRREFEAVERVLSFVADPFPWAEIESFADAILNKPELQLRVLPANRPAEQHSLFDYEVMRNQAYNRAEQEMSTLERLALARCTKTPTLIDGPLTRVMGNPKAGDALVIGVAKTHPGNYLHDKGWRTLLDLKPGQRTPLFRITGSSVRGEYNTPVASWYLKLAGGPRLAPNWGYVRVEIPWTQFEKDFKTDFRFVDRLSRWLMDARCRTDSYARMPVSLEPIVRAEEALKPLFTSLPVLVNRLYRTAGLFRGDET